MLACSVLGIIGVAQWVWGEQTIYSFDMPVLWVSDATADALEGVGEISGSPSSCWRRFCPSELREGRGG